VSLAETTQVAVGHNMLLLKRKTKKYINQYNHNVDAMYISDKKRKKKAKKNTINE